MGDISIDTILKKYASQSLYQYLVSEYLEEVVITKEVPEEVPKKKEITERQVLREVVPSPFKETAQEKHNAEEVYDTGEKEYVTFCCDTKLNQKTAKKIYDCWLKSEKLLRKILEQDKNNQEAAVKVLNKYTEKLLLLKNKTSNNGLKLAKELVKALKGIFKIYDIKNCKAVIDAYLDDCGFETIKFPQGKILDDEDFDYLGDRSFSDNTGKEGLKNTVKSMLNPVVKVRYETDDDEMNCEFIPGNCEYYA